MQAIVGAWFMASGLVACGGGGGSPATATAGLGATASFNVVATGPELKNQWQRNGAAIAGAPATGYTTGASNLRFTARYVGDRHTGFDCGAVTTGAAVSPCLNNTSLVDALAAGIDSASDGITYRLADGTLRTVGGVSIWVANAARPLSSTLTLTLQYRVYFALNGHVYTDALTPDGTPLGGSHYVSNPAGATVLDRLSFLPYQLRLNQAAHDSLAAALAI